jgi:NAD(P)-dependent dehydrogenase (short-subunit alcohol dehydrogenase family)
MELGGTFAVVTGGGAGIGEAIAVRLAAEGCAVGVIDLDVKAAALTVSRVVNTGGRAVALRADVALEADLKSVMSQVANTFGGIDILINNAGGAEDVTFPESPSTRWSRTIDIILRGTMFATQAVLPYMRRNGRGAIVNIASMAGVGFGPHGAPEYAAAKAGVMRLTGAMSGLAKEGIRVNCICPDWVDTPASRRTKSMMTEEDLATVPPVILKPEQIADAVVDFLVDDTAAGRVVEWRCGEDEPREITSFT